MKYFYFTLVAIFFITSCIEPFHPEVKKYEELLVIEGGITNEEPPYTIKLSLSTSIYNSKRQSVGNAEVQIIDSDNNIETFTEVEQGTYKSEINGMQGTVGKNYKLKITTLQGKIYETDFITMQKPVEIKEIKHEIEYHQDEISNENYVGVQFYLDTYSPDKDTAYYLWQNIETYKFNSDYPIDLIFDGYFYTLNNPDSLRTCYGTNLIKEIFTQKILKTDELAHNNIKLNYVNSTTKRLTIRYSLLVKQLIIDKQAYNYWSILKQLNSEQGSFYSTQPYQLKGNVYNINSSQEVVLGYFLVAGINQKRIFIDKPQIDFNNGTCPLDFDLRFIRYTPASLLPVYLVNYEGSLAKADPECFDCTLKGGKLQKPDFWID